MLNRSNLFLAALLVIQLVMLAIAVLATAGTATRAVTPILADIAVADVERLLIADNLDKEMTFARTDAGWVLPDADDFPLDSAKIDETLAKLADMDTRRLVASNPANFARLEVKDDDFRRRITLQFGGGRRGALSGRQRRRQHGLRSPRRG